MNEQHHNCEHFEAMIAAHFDADGISKREQQELSAHMATCASCRESFELSARMEEALISRRSDVPAVDAFLPAFVTKHVGGAADAARSRFAHPRLVAVFRTVMSPAGIAIIMTIWSALLALKFRGAIGQMFTWTTFDRLSALTNKISTALMGVSDGDPYTLAALYVALAVAVLASTGVITLKYIRHSS